MFVKELLKKTESRFSAAECGDLAIMAGTTKNRLAAGHRRRPSRTRKKKSKTPSKKEKLEQKKKVDDDLPSRGPDLLTTTRTVHDHYRRAAAACRLLSRTPCTRRDRR